MILAISESPCSRKPSSSFGYRENMVWKKMLVEEFQDGCLVHCQLWCVNGVIFANSESYMLPETFHSVFTQENIWFDRRRLKNFKIAVKGMAIFSVWMGLIRYSESPYYQRPSIKVLNKRIYGLEEDVGWRIPRCLDSAWKSLMIEWGDFSYFWVSYCRKPSIHFWSREYMVWKKMFVEEFQDGCLVHGHLWWVNGVILAISESPYCRKPSIHFWSREYMVWKKMFVEEFQDGCLVHGHFWCVNGMIFAISE